MAEKKPIKVVNLKPQQLKTMGYLVALGMMGLLLLAGGNLLGQVDKPLPRETREESPGMAETASPWGESTRLQAQEESLARNLEERLSQIQGAGRVMVMISLEEGTGYQLAENRNSQERRTEERDIQGGIRTITEANHSDQPVILRQAGGGNDEPLVLRATSPKVRGVLVIADGAADPVILVRLTEAVRTLLDLPGNKVKVLPRKVGE